MKFKPSKSVFWYEIIFSLIYHHPHFKAGKMHVIDQEKVLSYKVIKVVISIFPHMYTFTFGSG